jgi:hypothetical protein
MSVSGISAAASSHAASQQPSPSSALHRHHGHQTPSNTDIDAQGSSVASAPSSTHKIGSKINIAV